MSRLFYHLTKLFFYLSLKIYNRLRIIGRERIPREGQVMVIANHSSNLDPIVVGVAFPGRLRYLAKSELFLNPLLGFLIRILGAIPVSKETSQSAGTALKAFLSLLERGENILIFPEGARSFDGRLQPLEGGAALIAYRTGVPVIPAYVAGTFESMPRGSSLVRPSSITITFGEPLYPESIASGLPAREARQEIIKGMSEALKGLEAEHSSKRKGRN
ncbi:MAG: 1-acyl-sn-glycerol-3-phosphate acyltransferase [Synergistales bacterium]|nr:1-acyl-sn-glycerol-3-phosphate acyltransferase [Synergistales bacterium]